MHTSRTAKWQASNFIKGSAAAHLGAAAALAWPETRALGVAALVANHALLTAAGLWPKSTLLGPNIRHLDRRRPEVALTIDDGPDPEVTPQVLDLLAEHGVKATFFCIAANVSQHPALARRIVEAGHQIENHSMRHRHYFSLLGMKGLKNELIEAQQTIAAITGRQPQFFRAPAGLRNPLLDPVLHQLDLQLVSWTRRGFDTRISDAGRVSASLLANAKAGDILLLHDGNAARASNGRPVLLDVLPLLFGHMQQMDLRWVTMQQGMRA